MIGIEIILDTCKSNNVGRIVMYFSFDFLMMKFDFLQVSLFSLSVQAWWPSMLMLTTHFFLYLFQTVAGAKNIKHIS